MPPARPRSLTGPANAAVRHLPGGPSVWDAARIAECESVATLVAGAATLDDHMCDLGEACLAAEDEQRACQKRFKALRAEKRRAGSKPRK